MTKNDYMIIIMVIMFFQTIIFEIFSLQKYAEYKKNVIAYNKRNLIS